MVILQEYIAKYYSSGAIRYCDLRFDECVVFNSAVCRGNETCSCCCSCKYT